MKRGLVIFWQRLSWSIRYKIALAFALILFLFLVNGVVSTWQLLYIQQTQRLQSNLAVHKERLERYDLVFQNKVNIYADAIFLDQERLPRDTTDFIVYDAEVHLNSDEATQKFETELAQRYSVLLDDFASLKLLLGAEKISEAQQTWRQIYPKFREVDNLMEARREELKVQQIAATASLNNAVVFAIGSIAGLALVSILLTLYILYLVQRVVVQPLNRLQQGLGKVAEGDLTQQVIIANRDELGKLNQSFGQAVRALQNVLQGVQIGESLRMMTGQLAVVSEQQVAGSTEQLSALTEVVQSMQELGHTSHLIAENASQSAGLVSTTLLQIERVAAAGQIGVDRTVRMTQMVGDSLNNIEEIQERTENLSQHMFELEQQANAVNKIVNLLSGLAGEVHLLALNAAIEAAGAGQNSQRFKTVSREVRDLAKRANAATDEAQQLVASVQTGSRKATQQVAIGKARIGEMVQANSGLRDELAALQAGAAEMSQISQYLLQFARQVEEHSLEIRQATHQQLIASEQVTASARSIGQISQQVVHTGQEVSRTSHDLEDLTNQLNGVLAQVKLVA
jgi:methyl-accepting chemotaxis protein